MKLHTNFRAPTSAGLKMCALNSCKTRYLVADVGVATATCILLCIVGYQVTDNPGPTLSEVPM